MLLKFILHFKSLQVNEGYMMLIIYPDISTRKLCNFSNFLTGVSFFSFSGCQLKIMLPSLLCKIMSSLTLLEKYAFQSWMGTTTVFLTCLLVHLLAKKPICILTTGMPAFRQLPKRIKLDMYMLASCQVAVTYTCKLCGTTFVDSKLQQTPRSQIDKKREDR